MNIKNPVFNSFGGIDAEIEHKTHGLIPCTLHPDDPETAELFAVAEPDAAPAPPPDLERVRRDKRREINAAYTAALAVIIDDYPEAERLTWDKQEAEARAWSADNAAPTPYLDGIAAARGMALPELVARVIAKGDAWIAASSAATGKRKALQTEIQVAPDVATLEGIKWKN